jgi:phosphate transport system substrate-binding protein
MKTTQSFPAICGVLLALAFVAIAGCAAPPDRQTITVKGSDTMVLLGQRWAEVYMMEYPDAVIQVTGGGSGTGIAALINGTTQICESSRPMSAQEKTNVREQRNAEAVEIPVALDALAIYLNKENPVRQLTMEQVRRIFQADITNWKDVGGMDAPIVLYGRENNSGTYVYFKEHVLANGDFAERYQALPGTAAVMNAITKDPGGIGYGGIGYATDIKTIPIAADPSSPAVEPNMENVLNKSYPLSRFLFWYTAGPPEGPVKQFVDWVLSPEGQEIVSDVGYYPLEGGAASQVQIP